MWKLLFLLAVSFGAAFVLRRALLRPVVLSARPRLQPLRQFVLDFLCLVLAGLGFGLYGQVVLGFPFSASGSKVLLGAVSLAFFAALDLRLERERRLLKELAHDGSFRELPRNFSPLTQRFAVVALMALLLFTGILLLVMTKDIQWIVQSSGVDRSHAVRSVVLDISLVMGLFVLLLVNLIFSFSRNLRLLFENQTRTLERVSQGDLDVWVPAMTHDEFGYIAGRTNQMIDALRDRMRLVQGMQVASEIQSSLQPHSSPALCGCQLAAESRFSDETGGDYYDFLPLPDEDRRVLFALGDVSGHGVGAALLMASVRSLLRMRAFAGGTPGELCSDVNAMIARDTFGSGRFMTLFLMEYVPETKALSWVSAGHDPAIYIPAGSRTIEYLGGHNLPLGVQRDGTYETADSRTVHEGDLIVLATDGVWEARSSEGTMFGKKRLETLLMNNAHKKANEIVQAVIDALNTFTGSFPREDDMTLVVLRIGPSCSEHSPEPSRTEGTA